MKKKLLSVLLAVCMFLSIVPMAVFAVEEADIFASGDGTSAAKAYTIATLEQLEAFRDAVNSGNSFNKKFIKLTADIDMSSKYGAGKKSWTPIGISTKEFNGTFDGGEHRIDNLYIYSSEKEQALFGWLEDGCIKNLSVSGSVTSTSNSVSGIVSVITNGTISNCHNSCNVSGNLYVGGITTLVMASGGKISNCSNSGTIEGKGIYAAGIVGNDSNGNTKIYNCLNSGEISTAGDYVGGICGSGGKIIQNCLNVGKVTGSNRVGGICGIVGVIQNCLNVGKVTGSDKVGGICGYNHAKRVIECYYLDTTCSAGIGYNWSDTDSDTTNAKTADELASGEVAWLLQGTQTEQVWGQTLMGKDKDASPVLSSELSKKVCKVDFTDYAGTAYKTLYANYNGTVTLPTEPTVNDGYKFDGWFAEGSTTAFTASTLVTGDITLKAKQSLKNFTVTYKDGKDGAIFSDQTYTVVNGNTTPSFVGDLDNVTSYVFKGWDKTIAATVTQSVTYTAKWSNKAANTLRLLGNGGTTASGATISDSYTNAASIATGVNSFTRTGYTFKEWNNKADGKGASYAVGATVNFTAIHNAEMVTLYAIWTDIEAPVISGIKNGETYCSAQTVTVTDNGIIKSVTVNGKGVDLDKNGKFTLNPTTGEQTIVATDSDGNTATMKVTVNNGHTGGTATCTKQAECAVCGTPYGELKSHNYSDAWSSDETAHWHECVCGDKADYAEHTFEWVTDKEATTSETGEAHEECTVCHATRNEHTTVDKLPTAWDNFINWLVSIIAKALAWVFEMISAVC